MTIPVSDQRRLSHILADDLQPRIDWAYALEQTLALLGGGYVTAGNGDPNGLVTKPEGYLFLDLTTPAVWQNQNGGTVWTQLGSGGSGDLTDAVVLAPATPGRNEIQPTAADTPALVLRAKSDQTALGFKYFDKDGDLSVDIDEIGILDAKHIAVQDPPDTGSGPSVVVRPGRIDIAADGTNSPLTISGSLGGPAAGSSILHLTNPGGGNGLFQFTLFDPGDGAWEVASAVAQSAPLAVFWDNAFATRLWQVLANGGIVSNAHAAPADADLDNSSHAFWLDDTAGAPKLHCKAKDAVGAVFTWEWDGTPA